MTDSLQLFSGLVVQQPIEQVALPLFRAQFDRVVETTFEPTTILAELLRDGAHPDLVIAVQEIAEELIAENILDGNSTQVLVRSGLGLAIPLGAPVPQIDNLDAFIALLLQARSVAYSRTGASGIYFAKWIVELGIADAINAKATVIPEGYTGKCLLDGRADIALQQLSELRSVPGIHVLSDLPPDVQHFTTFVMANTIAQRDEDHGIALAGLRDAISGTDAQAAYSAIGLEAHPVS